MYNVFERRSKINQFRIWQIDEDIVHFIQGGDGGIIKKWILPSVATLWIYPVARSILGGVMGGW